MKLATLALLAGLIASPAFADPQTAGGAPAFSTVSSEAFAANPDGAILIDVRETSEWAQTGLPASAKGVSISQPDFVQRILAETGGDKTKPVAIICRSGNRSAKAAQQLTDAGFTNVTNIGDGMSGREGTGPGWIAAGLPTKAYSVEKR